MNMSPGLLTIGLAFATLCDAHTLGPGKYVVTYRVVSGDGHIMSGELHFTIDPNATPTAPKASQDHTR